jgi:cytochrome c oxidase subunit IV
MNNNIESIEGIFNQHLEPIVPGLENNLSSSSSSSYFSDFFNFFFNLSWTTWLIVVLVLAFLGINVFVYLAKGTESATNFFAPLLAKIAALFGTTVKKTVNVSAQGTQKIVNVSAGTATAGLSEIQNITDGTPGNAAQQPDIMINNSLNRSLNTSTQQKQQENGEDYVADDSTSPIQQGKMGWCFIGEDRGFRSCEQVGVNDQCMSGDIFPTKDVCMNPNLRA